MRTQENVKIVNWKFDGDQDHSGVRGGQLMRTQENPGVHEPSQSQSERDRQSDPTQVILQHGVDQEGDKSLQRSQFHRPWEMSSHVEAVPGFQIDHQGLYNSWWSNPTNESLYREPARVTSSLGFTPAANQMTDEELRQVLERPRSNPTLQARPLYESFSASYSPYSQLQAGLGLGWDHLHGGRNIVGMSQVVEGGNQEFYERQLAAQRFKERQRDDMFDRQEPRMTSKDLIDGSSVVQDSGSKNGELDEQQYLEELKNIRVDHSRAKKELERRRNRDKEELDAWVDMSQDGGIGTDVVRRRGRNGIDEGTKVLRRCGHMDGEKTFTVPLARADNRTKENTYLISSQTEEWWENEDREDVLGAKHNQKSYDFSESGPDEELVEDVWWEKERRTPFEERENKKVKPFPKLSDSKQKIAKEHNKHLCYFYSSFETYENVTHG